ncbi:MAG: acetyl-CoA acetyltransferase [Flavobacteriaceae bacterium TMED200]|nr:acetyl-CoA acetyltransferase [Flavobacteriaceae bacterium]OUW67055.1 MAG: acetyl-CoA acetyltransferase [Flavobacteriaceae bacterium TMED200]|tara:strand:+ start:449 stop:1651 length:1203 start_codon:yes stop_codon:yes gene_type:complete
MEAFIYDSVRTVRGKGNNKGALLGITPTELVKQTMINLKEKHNMDTTLVEDIILGCVTQVMDQAANIAKSAAQAADYGDHLCGVTLNRFCGSGLESINQAAAYIKSGYRDLIIAGGVECMSRVKMGSDGGGMFMDPDLAIPGNIIPQGISADLIASKYGYTREDTDKYAVESQKRAAKAEGSNYFKSRISVKDTNGIEILSTDENIRPDTNLNGLSSLMPAFEMIGTMGGFNDVALDKYPEVEKIDHVHHAGNSSAIVDGAAITLIGNKEIGEKLNLNPRFKILTAAIHGVDPTIMLTGPAPASMKALKQLGMKVSDIDLFEVNEAFSAIPMLFMEKTGVDPSIVNVNGGSIAMGHPLGATGCILTGTIMDEIERRDLNTGLVTLCIGGGMGIATIIERV